MFRRQFHDVGQWKTDTRLHQNFKLYIYYPSRVKSPPAIGGVFSLLQYLPLKHALLQSSVMVMKPVHEINIDIVRLIEATERLLITGEPSARGGWQHWPRFCKASRFDKLFPGCYSSGPLCSNSNLSHIWLIHAVG